MYLLHTLFGIKINKVNRINFESHLFEDATAIGKIGIWQFDCHSNTVAINRKFSHYFQNAIDYSEDDGGDAIQLKFEDFIALFHINHRGIVKRLLENARDEQSSFDVSLQLELDLVWIKILGYPTKNVEGDVVSVQGLFQDVSELMSSQLLALDYQNAIDSLSRLIVSKDFYELESMLKEALQIAVEYLHIDVGIISSIVGEEYQVLQFYTHSRRIKTQIGETFPLKETYSTMVIDLNEAVFLESVSNSEYREMIAHQKYKVGSYIGIPLFVKGQFFGTLDFASFQDRENPFTELQTKFCVFLGKWMEMIIERHDLISGISENLNIIQEKESLFEAVFRDNPNIFVLVDSERKIVSVNNEFEKIFGYQENEVLGQSTSFLYLDKANYNKVRQKYIMDHPNDEILLMDVDYLKKDGSSFKGRTVGTKVKNAHGEIIGFCANITDLTEDIKKSELLEEQEQELAREKEARFQSSKMVALGEMAGGVAHEINNPLTIIEGFSINLIRRFEKNIEIDKEKITRSLEKIIDASQRISKIVRGLKSFARDDRGDDSINFSLNEMIEETLSFCQQRFHNNGVDFTYTELKDGEVNIHGHPIQISQVLLNLLNNAFDAILLDDQIADKWIKLLITRKNIEGVDSVELRVIDAGRGIPERLHRKMMEPFFTTKEVGKGTGLGLSISKGIIQKHNGQFGYELFNENTSFYVRLPILK